MNFGQFPKLKWNDVGGGAKARMRSREQNWLWESIRDKIPDSSLLTVPFSCSSPASYTGFQLKSEEPFQLRSEWVRVPVCVTWWQQPLPVEWSSGWFTWLWLPGFELKCILLGPGWLSFLSETFSWALLLMVLCLVRGGDRCLRFVTSSMISKSELAF